MMKRIGLSCVLMALLCACQPDPKSSKGFHLPDGDVEAGKVVFQELRCVKCHTVEGSEFEVVPDGPVEVHLGGKVIHVRSYGELVTAIINPSHDLAKGYDESQVSKDGKSLMADYNAVMTVQQLIDLVAFLQSTYTEYLQTDYDPYFP